MWFVCPIYTVHPFDDNGIAVVSNNKLYPALLFNLIQFIAFLFKCVKQENFAASRNVTLMTLLSR